MHIENNQNKMKIYKILQKNLKFFYVSGRRRKELQFKSNRYIAHKIV